jgi:hypothetical protein
VNARFDQHKVARLPVGNIDRRDTNCAKFGASAIRDKAGAGMKKRFTTCWQEPTLRSAYRTVRQPPLAWRVL